MLEAVRLLWLPGSIKEDLIHLVWGMASWGRYWFYGLMLCGFSFALHKNSSNVLSNSIERSQNFLLDGFVWWFLICELSKSWSYDPISSVIKG